MRRALPIATCALAAFAATAHAQDDPLGIPTGRFTGWYRISMTSGNQSKEVRATLRSTTADTATFELEDGRKLSLLRKNEADKVKLIGKKGITNVIDGNAGATIDLTVRDRVTIVGTIVDKTANGAEVKTQLVARRVPAPPRSPEELAEFDRGPSPEVKAVFDAIPKEYTKYFNYFWHKFGPVFYRGRLDKSARVLIMGSDPGPTECLPWVRRCFVGDSGQRMQGLLSKAGLRKSYVFMNAFAFALFPSASNAGKGDLIHGDPAIVAWRNKCYEAVVGPDLQAIVVVGFQAKKALDLWPGRPDVPVIYVPHPSRFDGEPDSNLLPAYRSAVTKLRQYVTPDDPALAAGPNYGEEFTEFDFSPIPRRDLPEGGWVNNQFERTPDFIGSDSWTRTPLVPIHNAARRPSPDTGDALIYTTPEGVTRKVIARPHPTGDPLRNPRFVYGD